MKWIGGAMDLEAAREVALLDQKIEQYTHRNRTLDEEIILLTHKLRR